MKKDVLIVLILLFVAWDGIWRVLGVRSVSPWRLESMLSSSTSRPLLLDVRTPVEYGWFHIADAIPSSGWLTDSDSLNIEEKSTPIVIIRMTGHRSVFVVYGLHGRGLTRYTI